MLDADKLRVDSFTKLEREEEEWAVVWSLRRGGHGAGGVDGQERSQLVE